MSGEYVGSIAGYRLLGPMRVDSIGQVFLGDHDTPPRHEDLRILPPGAAADDAGIRFHTQARALARLHHPGLPRVTHHGIDQQYAWLATTHLDGVPLPAGRRDDAEAFAIASLVADALDHAHRSGVLHTDLAPEGILLTAATPPGAPGSVVVLDIGVIGLMPRHQANPLSGGTSYTAPEVRAGGTAGAPADQYSLAAILFTLLTGMPPAFSFTGFGAHRPDLTVLDPIFARALADSPAQRYPDCRSFVGSASAARSATIPVADDPVPSLRGRAQPTVVPADTTVPAHTAIPTDNGSPSAPSNDVSGSDAPDRSRNTLPPPDPVAPAPSAREQPPTPTLLRGLPEPPPPPDTDTDTPSPSTPSRRSRRHLGGILALVVAAVVIVAVAVSALVILRSDTAPAQTTTATTSSTNGTTCTIREGSVWCWGENSRGRVGDGTTENRTSPVRLSGLSDVTGVAVSWTSVCAIAGGALYCWGGNDNGQLGDGSTTDRLEPTRVGALSGVSSVATGTDLVLDSDRLAYPTTTCAVAGGSLYCWGDNSHGQVGDGTLTARHTPTRIGGVPDATAVTTSSAVTCALTAPGEVYCWGKNTLGTLGDGSDTDQHVPVRIPGLSRISAVTTAVGTTCVIGTEGRLYCWGNNRFGQLGDSSRRPARTPQRVADLPPVTAVSTESQTVCAVADDKLYCWGNNPVNAAGPDERGYLISPLEFPDLPAPVTAVATAGYNTCATAGGKLLCWGANTDGQLGIGDTTSTANPGEVLF
ncbi:protein kinase domain-containing protein [Gordonia sp. NPDC003376]